MKRKKGKRKIHPTVSSRGKGKERDPNLLFNLKGKGGREGGRN